MTISLKVFLCAGLSLSNKALACGTVTCRVKHSSTNLSEVGPCQLLRWAIQTRDRRWGLLLRRRWERTRADEYQQQRQGRDQFEQAHGSSSFTMVYPIGSALDPCDRVLSPRYIVASSAGHRVRAVTLPPLVRDTRCDYRMAPRAPIVVSFCNHLIGLVSRPQLAKRLIPPSFLAQ